MPDFSIADPEPEEAMPALKPMGRGYVMPELTAREQERNAVEAAASKHRLANQMRPPEGQSAAADLVNAVTGSSTLAGVADLFAPRPPQSGLDFALPQLGTFAGIGSRTADQSMLRRAAKLEAEGVSPDDIWTRTGWGRGTEKEWRNEIDDTGMTHSLVSGPAQPIESMIEHPEFFKAYPEMKKLYIREDPTHQGGWFDENLNEIVIGTRGRSHEQINDTILHELQHAVQKHEGFARGGNVGGYVVPGTPTWGFYQERLNKLLTEHPKSPDITSPRDQYYGLPEQEFGDLAAKAREYARRENYRRLAGEVEARNAGRRGVMSRHQRRNTPPEWTEDYTRDQQIIKR